ncbi:MAG: ABC transporter ATP-binding protein [Clostridiales bacterium]|nr:ABC transporter ATP-binding protein [Clostridiales bacterium]
MIKRLSQSIRQYKRPSILTPVFVIGEVILEVLIPFLMADLIDYGIDMGNMDVIVRYGIILVILALASLTCGAMAGKFGAEASAGFARNLRHDMYYNVQNFSFTNIDKFSTSSIITRLTTDVTNVQMAFLMIIRFAVRAPSMMIFAFAMTVKINPSLSLIFLVALCVLGLGLFFIIRNAHPIFEKVFKTYDKLNKVVQENLRGMRVVKAYVREDHENEKFRDVSQRIFDLFSKAEKLLALNGPLMQFVVYACMLLVCWFGAGHIVSGNMTTGQLVSVTSYAMQILMSLMILSMILVMITISRASAERIVEVLDEKSDIVNGESPVMEVKSGDVVFKNVDFSYADDPEKLCLSGVNLTIKEGQTVGILGGTGSAKSSLVQLIPRLYDVTAGQILVGGVDVREYDLDTLRSEVAMVLQKNVLFSGTIKENLRWGDPNASDEDLIRVCKLAQAHEFIETFPDGYDTHIEQGGSNVSGGQKQRLCIARALLKKPKILILDDSTSAVDTKTDASIRKAFREEIPNTTKFIIAQRISSVEDADLIIIMDSGKVAAVGSPAELMETNEIYREVYESQTKGGGLLEE